MSLTPPMFVGRRESACRMNKTQGSRLQPVVISPRECKMTVAYLLHDKSIMPLITSQISKIYLFYSV